MIAYNERKKPLLEGDESGGLPVQTILFAWALGAPCVHVRRRLSRASEAECAHTGKLLSAAAVPAAAHPRKGRDHRFDSSLSKQVRLGCFPVVAGWCWGSGTYAAGGEVSPAAAAPPPRSAPRPGDDGRLLCLAFFKQAQHSQLPALLNVLHIHL